MFTKVLVANRGEIAVRVMRTLKSMGIASVAVFSEADVDALHVASADEAVLLGPADAASSYLNIERVVDAALRTGAQAIHPGYGFLSENTAFAAACLENGIVFIGPSPTTIASMGDKIQAKTAVEALGLRVVPGFSESQADDERLVQAAASMGLPIIIKPSAGGGGKGMRVVSSHDQLPAALASARREAMSSFGDDTLLLERFIETARHVEVQVVADTHGNVLHAGDRDCSLQRRHQKVVEEAPAPNLPDDVRASMQRAAVEIARSVDYVGVGTVEFVVDALNPQDHFFLEMNTRLQVEHPVTEAVTGLDLVELQVRIAAGEALPLSQDDIVVRGHAVEARVYAEDGNRGFLPSSGRLLAYSVPDGARVDSGVRTGDVIGTNYDPLLFKVITSAEDRETALTYMDNALRDVVVLGVANNIQVLRALVQDPDVRSATLSTGLIEARGLGREPLQPSDHALCGAALLRQQELARHASGSAWDIVDGWRVGATAPTTWVLSSDGNVHHHAVLRVAGDDSFVRLGTGDEHRVALVPLSAATYSVLVDDRAERVSLVQAGPVTWVAEGGRSYELHGPTVEQWDDEADGEHGLDRVRSPMPGTVIVVGAQEGDNVTKGSVLVVVEAMKMEFPLIAPHDGVVSSLLVEVGQTVRKEAVVAEVTPAEATLEEAAS
jgi:acetyl-CoA/propionyl-CoA carboxylase, biotin carboxylase, biotin carboxyl carrier protein